MEQAEEIRRWETAQELYEAAKAALQQHQYRACVGLAYYACFQVMWVALGDPPAGAWRHVGITRRFCHGQWTDPPLLPTSLALVHTRLLTLYELRLDAHYRAQPIPPSQAQLGLETVTEVMQLVQQHKSLRATEGV
ncbi:MAG: hypothetical protein AB7P18_01370 [Candidatus Binatia bacterium]